MNEDQDPYGEQDHKIKTGTIEISEHYEEDDFYLKINESAISRHMGISSSLYDPHNFFAKKSNTNLNLLLLHEIKENNNK
jgi:hypothetical protein